MIFLVVYYLSNESSNAGSPEAICFFAFMNSVLDTSTSSFFSSYT